MDKRYGVRPVRACDIERILEIEAASFGSDAYDRNLFAEYTRKCGALFLVALWGNKVIAYSIAAISANRAGTVGELVSVAVDPAYLGKGAAAALMDSTLRRLRRRGATRLAADGESDEPARSCVLSKVRFSKNPACGRLLRGRRRRVRPV